MPHSFSPRYSRCPKCGHHPLPQDQALPASCPHCGVILAKAGQTVRRPLPKPDDAGVLRDTAAGWLAPLTQMPDPVNAMRFWSQVALLAALALWSWVLISLDLRTGEFKDAFLHRPLLVFHEAGHVIFMPFGEWFTVLGGTLGQLLMPLIMAGALLFKNRDPFGASVGLWFLGVSLLDVAPYVYDALVPQLMLLSGHTGEDGGHDWIYLLSSLGLLAKAQLLGNLTHKLGALVMLLALGWGAWLLAKQHARVQDRALQED